VDMVGAPVVEDIIARILICDNYKFHKRLTFCKQQER
jgi:hypothetical protein